MNRYWYLAGGTITLLFIGLIYAWSIFSAYLGVNRVESTLVFTVTMCGFSVGSLMSPWVSERFHLRGVCWTSALLLAAGFLSMVLGTRDGYPSVGSLIVGYGVCVGLASGVGYNALLTMGTLWFPDKTGLASGILLMGFGLSSLLLGNISHFALALLGWKMTFIGLAVLGFLFLFIVGLFLKLPPEDFRAPQSAETRSGAQTKPPVPPVPRYTRWRQFFNRDMVIFYIWRTLLLAAGLSLIGNAAVGAQNLGFSSEMAALLVGLVAVCNGAARMVVGIICDKLGLRSGVFLATFLMTACLISITLAIYYGIGILYFGAGFLTGFAYGSITICSTVFCHRRFGAVNYSHALALINTNTIIAPILNMVIVRTLSGVAGETGIYFCFIIVCLVACGLVICLFQGKKGARLLLLVANRKG